jgi:eight-cysteine-cluster-containing protein
MKNASRWLILGVLLAACGDAQPAKSAAEMPEVISQDGKGDWRTAAFTDFRGTIRLNDTLVDYYDGSGEFMYQGYELALEAGDIVEIRANAVTRDFDAVAGLYGPQRPSGAWGNLVASNDDSAEGGTYNSLIRFEAARAGNYLVIVRDYGFQGGDFALSATCAGGTCAENACAPVVCEEYCPYGRQTDHEGCETCMCNPAPSCQWTNPAPWVRCAGVETYAQNPVDGTCCTYPSPCNVPEGYEVFATEGECKGVAAEGDACSMYGLPCADGLECQYQCPDGSNDPNCNLGINPTGVCVASVPPQGTECQVDSDCVVSGCSGQICAAESRITTCEYRPEYACYGEPTTSCGCNNGTCGWDQTEALANCLAQ